MKIKINLIEVNKIKIIRDINERNTILDLKQKISESLFNIPINKFFLYIGINILDDHKTLQSLKIYDSFEINLNCELGDIRLKVSDGDCTKYVFINKHDNISVLKSIVKYLFEIINPFKLTYAEMDLHDHKTILEYNFNNGDDFDIITL